MTRYLFHCIGPQARSIDEVGLELPDIDAARGAALQLASALRSEDVPDRWCGWIVEVSDERGSTVFTARLATLDDYH